MLRLQPTTLFLLLLSSVTAPLSAHAETKVLTAEATYTMGDGESPSFAEAMVLQKAKQMALEQAGTYVESYTKVQNLNLTTEEIQTIAGGVLQVDVLEKTRTLVGDGLRFYVKIKATVTTDKMEELARRIKGKNMADEYKKLQGEYSRLTKEIETWKQLVVKTPHGPERERALEQIREREKTFAGIQKSEAAFFQRLVSGEALFSKALGQLSKKHNDKSIADALFQKIAEQGYLVEVGEPDIRAELKDPKDVEIRIPISLSVDEPTKRAVQETARALAGITTPTTYFDVKAKKVLHGLTVRIAEDREVNNHFLYRLVSLRLVIEFTQKSGDSERCALYQHLAFPFSPAQVRKDGQVSLLYGDEGWGYDLEAEHFNSGSWFLFVRSEPMTITVAMPMSLEEAKRVRAVRTRIVEGKQQMASCHVLGGATY